MSTMQKTDTNDAMEPQGREEDLKAIASAMEARSKTYGLLARIFRVEVDQELLDQLRGMRFPADTGNEHLDQGARLLCQYLARGWDDTLLDLARDYVRAFIGHGVNGASAAYPYESVYTSEKRLLMQGARADVLRYYRDNLLKKSQDWRDCEDHIALELEFMQVMAARSAKDLKAGREQEALENLRTQRAFVYEHLINWVPLMTADMRRFAQTAFYHGVSELLLGFIQTERETLDDMLGQEDPLTGRPEGPAYEKNPAQDDDVCPAVAAALEAIESAAGSQA